MFGSKINPSGAAADLGDEIANSIRFNDGDSPELSYTPASSPTDSRKTFTLSFWFKRCTLAAQQWLFDCGTNANANLWRIYLDTADQMVIYSETSGGATGKTIKPSMKFRDTHGWYHVVVNWDTSQATASDRRRIYVNGVEITAYDTDEARAQNDEVAWNAVDSHNIGHVNSTSHADCYFAKIEHFANQRLEATAFGRFSTSHTNMWVPITTTASFGTNDVDFQLLFGTAPGTGAGAGDDTSGNANDWTESGLASNDQMPDTPTNNHCVMSSIDKDPSTATTLSDGNLKVSMSTTAGDGVRGTMALRGKKYWEVELDTVATNSGSHIGVATSDHNLTLEAKNAGNSNAFLGVNSFDSNLTGFFSGSAVDSAYGGLGNNFAAAGNYMMFALDTTAGKFWAGYNGTWFNSGDPGAGTNDSGKDMTLYDNWLPAISRIGSASSEDFIFNFGQHTFNHTVPTGFTAPNQENDQNLVTDLGGTDKPYESVQLITASGDNIVSDLDAALGSGSFLKIYKNIDTGSTAWKWVFPDDTGNMWDSSVNTGKTTYSAPSGSDTFAGIAIKIDTSVGTASSEVSHTSGSSTNYAHGLGVTPAFVILFPNLTANKRVFHSALDSGKLVRLDDQQAQATDSSFTVDATNVTISSSLATGDYRILAFSEIDGFSSFKFHDTNSSADGPFVYHGFSPLFEITVDIDLTDNALDWDLFSYKLESHLGNVLDFKIALNEQNAKNVAGYSGVLDHVSNGSKTRTSGSQYNISSRDHIRVAFAHSAVGGGIPFPNAR